MLLLSRDGHSPRPKVLEQTEVQAGMDRARAQLAWGLHGAAGGAGAVEGVLALH